MDLARLGSARLGPGRQLHSPPLSPGCEIEGGRKEGGGCKQKFPQQTVNQSRLQTPRLSKHGRRWRGEPKQSVRGRRREAGSGKRACHPQIFGSNTSQRLQGSRLDLRTPTSSPASLNSGRGYISHSPRCGRAFSSQPP